MRPGRAARSTAAHACAERESAHLPSMLAILRPGAYHRLTTRLPSNRQPADTGLDATTSTPSEDTSAGAANRPDHGGDGRGYDGQAMSQKAISAATTVRKWRSTVGSAGSSLLATVASSAT